MRCFSNWAGLREATAPFVARNRAIADAFRQERDAEALLWEREAEEAANPDDDDAHNRVLDAREGPQLAVALRISLQTSFDL